MPVTRRTAAVLLALALALPAAAVPAEAPAQGPAQDQPQDQPQGEATPKAPPLAVESIEVRPPNPGPDTLCQLRVRVRNRGSRQASALGFTVRVGGQELAVYRNQLYLQTIAPGAAGEVRLFNFWTSETGRPAPADGKLKVEVTLAEARWVEVKTENGAEVWRPAGTVEGLPASAALVLDLRSAGKRQPAS